MHMAVDDRESIHFLSHIRDPSLSTGRFSIGQKVVGYNAALPPEMERCCLLSKVVIQNEIEMTNAGMLYWVMLKGRLVYSFFKKR